jgi:hypothetical protein
MRLALLTLTLAFAGCDQGTELPDSNDGDGAVIGDDYTDTLLAAQWADILEFTVEDDTITIDGGGVPDHDVLDLYAVPGGSTLSMDGTIATGSVSIRKTPVMAASPTDTGLGVIGVAISGGWFFNPYEGDGTSVALDSNFEVDGVPFIDSCNGHPLPSDLQYHYHGIPYCITDVIDSSGEHSVLLGVLRDGFPMYGPQDEDGEAPGDLDGCSGHTGATPEFLDGIYHYHVTETAPYIVTCFSGEVDASTGGGGPGGGPPQ